MLQLPPTHTDGLCTTISSLLSNVDLTSMFNIYSISQTKPLTFFLKLDPLFGFLSTVKGTTIHCFHMSKTLESPLTHPLPRVRPPSPLDFIYIYFVALVVYLIYSTTTTTSNSLPGTPHLNYHKSLPTVLLQPTSSSHFPLLLLILPS